VRELCARADLLIHGAQYTPGEFVHKAHWGHCTVDCGARRARVRGAAPGLFHHDPDHDDDMVDRLAARHGAEGGRSTWCGL
jgi:ribonuclease BN (tRNA processing enzyme)